MNQSFKKKYLRVQIAPEISATSIAMPKTCPETRTYTEEEVQDFVGTVLDMAVQLLQGNGKREAPREVLENDSEARHGPAPAPARRKRVPDTDKEIICNTPIITAEPPRPTIDPSLPFNNVSRKRRSSRQNTRAKSQDLCAARRLQRETPLASWME
ncbi:hypothetical protein BPOR_0190g00150 [Botrytis porri]|uniref:Uncharacterized protein n=1 Tax=Botrytis porri TaxID=87229 RepID=A0A4Z1KU15_9HELO|nr:hypothetical protein BPOR_0190g00150 [Botrytis porri]